MDPIEQKLSTLETAITSFTAKAAEERQSLGAAQAETKATLDNLQKQFDALVLEMKKPGGANQQKSFAEELKENESVSRLLRDGKGRAYVTIKGGLRELELKTTVTSSSISTSGTDIATSGVLQIDRTAGIVAAARRRLFVEDLLSSIPTSMQKIDYVKVENDVADASPQVEASDKFENALSFTTAEASVRTIATWMPATKQILEDFDGLEGFIRQSLVYAVRKETEDQLLTGDNTGQNLNGLITQATNFNTGLTVAGDGWKYADLIGRAIQQIQVANEVDPSFVAVNPAAWWQMRLQKTSTGEYTYGDPSNGAGNFSMFGLTVIPTNALSSTQFLVGASAPTSAVIRERTGMEIEISTEHSDYFVKNMVAIRAERRLALVVFRPASFIKGTFTQSPA